MFITILEEDNLEVILYDCPLFQASIDFPTLYMGVVLVTWYKTFPN